jgi:hypothetical protein
VYAIPDLHLIEDLPSGFHLSPVSGSDTFLDSCDEFGVLQSIDHLLITVGVLDYDFRFAVDGEDFRIVLTN